MLLTIEQNIVLIAFGIIIILILFQDLALIIKINDLSHEQKLQPIIISFFWLLLIILRASCSAIAVWAIEANLTLSLILLCWK